MICYACEGRLAKPLAIAALIDNPAVIGWGGLHGLGRCLPPEPTVVVVEDAPPADPTKTAMHALAMARGCDRLIAGGRIVLRAGGPPCECCKDVDAALHKIAETAGQLSTEQAGEFVKQLKFEKRYLRDVY